MIFNEEEFFNGNVEELRDDLCALSEEDLKKALEMAELPETDVEDEATGQAGEEDDVIELADLLPTATGENEAEEEGNSSANVYTDARFEPFPMPPQP